MLGMIYQLTFPPSFSGQLRPGQFPTTSQLSQIIQQLPAREGKSYHMLPPRRMKPANIVFELLLVLHHRTL